jgi:hypothetical protein
MSELMPYILAALFAVGHGIAAAVILLALKEGK